MLRQPRKEDGRGRFVCFDGTGTRVKRQIRSMREAREAGFDVVQLYVEVSWRQPCGRNQQRDRTVPEEVLKEYLDRLDSAVEATVQHPDGLVDAAIAMNNDLDDDFNTDASRFGRHAGVDRVDVAEARGALRALAAHVRGPGGIPGRRLR